MLNFLLEICEILKFVKSALRQVYDHCFSCLVYSLYLSCMLQCFGFGYPIFPHVTKCLSPPPSRVFAHRYFSYFLSLYYYLSLNYLLSYYCNSMLYIYIGYYCSTVIDRVTIRLLPNLARIKGVFWNKIWLVQYPNVFHLNKSKDMFLQFTIMML